MSCPNVFLNAGFEIFTVFGFIDLEQVAESIPNDSRILSFCIHGRL